MCRAAAARCARDHEHVPVVALVRVSRPRGQQAAHARARQQLDARTVHAIDHVVGDADVRDDDVARMHLRRRHHERQLRGAERYGDRRVDAVANELARLGGEP